MFNFKVNLDVGKQVTIDWGDSGPKTQVVGIGEFESYSRATLAGVHQIRMWGDFTYIRALLLDDKTGGPIGDFLNLPNLSSLQVVTGNSVDGDIGALSEHYVLESFLLEGSAVTGDFNQFASLPNLVSVSLKNTIVTYTTTTLPVWDDIILDFENCSWTQAMVDALLVDLDTSGSVDGDLELLGNAAPSAPGLTAKANLISKGWSVSTA